MDPCHQIHVLIGSLFSTCHLKLDELFPIYFCLDDFYGCRSGLNAKVLQESEEVILKLITIVKYDFPKPWIARDPCAIENLTDSFTSFFTKLSYLKPNCT